MTQSEDAKLAPTQELEERMAVIICAWCGNKRRIVHNPGMTDTHTDNDVIRGVLTCGNPSCKRKTLFEMTGDDPSFLPGKLFQEDLLQNVAKDARTMFEEAVLCFYGSSFRGVMAMCRGALEEALVDKKIHGTPKDDLDGKINEAKLLKVLGDAEVSQAHGARLIGNKALHAAMPVTQSQAQLALGATVYLLNHIAQYKPTPAKR